VATFLSGVVRNAGDSSGYTAVSTAASRVPKRRSHLNSLLIRLKILPNDVNLNPNVVAESIQNSLPVGMTVKRKMEEPIAYGIVALIMDIQIPEKDGVLETLENTVRSSKFVSEFEVLGVSKLSTKIG